MFVDSHVNLHGERYADDLEAVFERARASGVGAMLAISDQLSSTEEIRQVVAGRPAIWRSIGVHPHHAKDYQELRAETLIEMAAPADVVAIGECGLDYYYEYSDRDAQEAVFRAHIAAAQHTGLPLIIHTRDADDRMQGRLCDAYKERAFVPLLHCYTGGPELADSVLEMGGYVAFSGILTFKNAHEVRSVAKQVPLDRILIETDCPFLAPVPHRGKRNEPAFLPHVAEALATLKDVSVETVANETTENFFRLFDQARPRP